MIKNINANLLTDLTTMAKTSDRKRTHYNLHPQLDDPVQRLVIAIEPGSYIRPHRHSEKGKWELFVVLKGAAVMLVFDEKGKVTQRFELSVSGSDHAVEVTDQAWHTLAALESGTVLAEFKPGPYAPLADKDFAVWAPAEREEAAAMFEKHFRKCKVGDILANMKT